MSSTRPDNRALLREQLLARLPSRAAEGVPGDRAGSALAPTGTADDRTTVDASEPFSMLPLQAAYYLGREVDGVACHGYLELDVRDLDAARLNGALRRLVQRHEGLRTVVDDGRLRVLDLQQVLPLTKVSERDLRATRNTETALAELRHELSHQVLPADRFPLFSLTSSRLDADHWRLHLSVDVLIADAQSFEILSRELVALYADPEIELAPLTTTFHAYVDEASARRAAEVPAARAYWRDRLADLPPAPELPLLEAEAAPRFRRAEAFVPASVWAAVTDQARARAASAATAGLAVFAEVLGAWSRDPRFTINVTRFNREPVHSGIEAVVGSFTDNFLAVVDLPAHETVADTCEALQRQLWDALEHRALSGVELLRESARQGGPAQVPVVFTYVGDAAAADFRTRLGEIGDVVYAVSQTPGVLLDCQLVETENGLGVWWDHDETRLEAQTVDGMLACFVRLVHDLVDPDCWAHRAPARVPAEHRAVREKTEVWQPAPRASLWQLVRDAAARTPGAVAVREGDLVVTYAELVQAARRVAVAVAAQSRSQLVGLHVDRGWHHVACLLGIVAAGRAYLPVDITLPEARIAEVLHAGGADLVLSGGRPPSGPWEVLPPGRLLDAAPGGRAHAALAPDMVEAEIDGDDLAYVMFTSGSTGRPKGVRMQHGAVVNTVVDVNARIRLAPTDAVLAVSSPGFDLSVWDVFGTLAAGGTLVTIAGGLRAKDPLEWLDRMQRDRVTVWNSAPAPMSLLLDEAIEQGVVLSHLRMVMLSGDWIPLGLKARLERVAPHARLLSLGGATEAAIWSVAFPVDTIDPRWASIPYGFPLTNQSLLVLDWARRERPVGVPGELHIAGLGVADGYWQAPEQTARAFSEREGQKVYATGDQVRRGADGCLEFLGRRDSQVKVHGHRIELTEVDAALARCRGVVAAATQVVGPRDGHRYLGSAVVLEPDVDAALVKRELESVLPTYMLPRHLVLCDVLPMTVNGKVDRERLTDLVAGVPGALPVGPEGGSERRSEDGTDGPDGIERPGGSSWRGSGPLAAAVLRLVRDHTAMPGLELDTDVLKAGLDSIDLVRLGGALERATGVRPSLEQLLSRPTARRVAELVEQDLASRVGAGLLRPVSATDIGVPVDLIHDPVDRELFRRDLPVPVTDPGARRLRLGDGGVDTHDPVSALLHGALPRMVERDGRRPWQTPGGIGGVRCEIWLRDGYAGAAAGLHVLNPADGDLVSLDPTAVVDPAGLDPFVYAPLLAGSPWLVAMVVDLTPYWSLYGTEGVRFASLEAGAMAQLVANALAPHHPVRLVPLVERERLGVPRWSSERVRVEQVVLLDRSCDDREMEEGAV